MPSASATRTLTRLMSNIHADPLERDLREPAAASPTLIKVRDPVEDVETVVEIEMEGNAYGRKANRTLRRQQSLLGVDEEGERTLDGRRCCYELARSIDRQLHRIRMPADFTCECGTVWRIESRVREERRHG